MIRLLVTQTFALTAKIKSFRQAQDYHAVWPLPAVYVMWGEQPSGAPHSSEHFCLLGLRFWEWDLSIALHVRQS